MFFLALRRAGGVVVFCFSANSLCFRISVWKCEFCFASSSAVATSLAYSMNSQIGVCTTSSFWKIADKQSVRLQVFTQRPVIFEDTIVRVRDDFATFVHLDYDEANACGFTPGDLGRILL